MTDTDALIERIARAIHLDDLSAGEAEPWGVDAYLMAWYRRNAAAVLPIVAVEVRKAKAEAFDSFCNALADHLDLATPRAWDFHHPCDPPDTRWEPTERDQALMAVADMLRHDTRNPYRGEQTNGWRLHTERADGAALLRRDRGPIRPARGPRRVRPLHRQGPP